MSTTTTALGQQPEVPHNPPIPSPLPSPNSQAHPHRRKRRDSLAALINSPPLSPTTSEPEEPFSTRIRNIILTPFLLTSFIISLTLVSLHDRYKRAIEHPSSRTNWFLTYFNPEPYEDVGTTSPSGDPGERAQKKRNSWHLTKKIRKITRLEVSDAFEMRGQVLVGMAVVGLLGVMVLWAAVRWVAGWAFGA